MDWEAQYSRGVTLRPVPAPAVLKFSFPRHDGIHYLVKPVNGIVGKIITMTYSVISQGAIFTCSGGTTPTLRFYFQHKEDNMLGTGDNEFRRWWSNPVSAKIEPGKRVLSVKLEPDQWSSVFGKYGTKRPELFKSAIKNAGRLGITFGSESQFGHGVWLKDGSAVFRLISFTP